MSGFRHRAIVVNYRYLADNTSIIANEESRKPSMSKVTERVGRIGTHAWSINTFPSEPHALLDMIHSPLVRAFRADPKLWAPTVIQLESVNVSFVVSDTESYCPSPEDELIFADVKEDEKHLERMPSDIIPLQTCHWVDPTKLTFTERRMLADDIRTPTDRMWEVRMSEAGIKWCVDFMPNGTVRDTVPVDISLSPATPTTRIVVDVASASGMSKRTHKTMARRFLMMLQRNKGITQAYRVLLVFNVRTLKKQNLPDWAKTKRGNIARHSMLNLFTRIWMSAATEAEVKPPSSVEVDFVDLATPDESTETAQAAAKEMDDIVTAILGYSTLRENAFVITRDKYRSALENFGHIRDSDSSLHVDSWRLDASGYTKHIININVI